MTDENDPIDDDDEVIEAKVVDESVVDEAVVDQDSAQDDVTDRPIGRRIQLMSIVGIACLLLALMGIVLFSLTLPAVLDPDSARCEFAQREIDAANADEEDFNDVVVDGDEVVDGGDLACEDALALASSIPTSDDGDDLLSIPNASTVRTSSAVAAALGLLQCVTGVGTLMVASRAFRTAAATSALVGTIIAVIPILPLVIGIFVVWAFLFSRQAKAIWGPVRFLGGSRRSSEA